MFDILQTFFLNTWIPLRKNRIDFLKTDNLLITSLLVLCSQWFRMLLFLPPKFLLISWQPIYSYSDICYLGTGDHVCFLSMNGLGRCSFYDLSTYLPLLVFSSSFFFVLFLFYICCIYSYVVSIPIYYSEVQFSVYFFLQLAV